MALIYIALSILSMYMPTGFKGWANYIVPNPFVNITNLSNSPNRLFTSSFFNPLIDLIPLPKQILRQILSLLSFCGVTGPVLNTVNRKPNLSNPSRNKSIRHSKMAVSSFLIHHFLYYNILPRTVMNIYVISINMFSVSSVCFILLFQWIC